MIIGAFKLVELFQNTLVRWSSAGMITDDEGQSKTASTLAVPRELIWNCDLRYVASAGSSTSIGNGQSSRFMPHGCV
jgi:hypothetical protein